ncbi:hypothetical protein H8356DRAFT_1349496 [Neocallimastix lanati (nom. inval.)]|nr:hypothetical protein H8356DRAFT_1349496 [Neocallimastix sp. JGI-2020a]
MSYTFLSIDHQSNDNYKIVFYKNKYNNKKCAFLYNSKGKKIYASYSNKSKVYEIFTTKDNCYNIEDITNDSKDFCYNIEDITNDSSLNLWHRRFSHFNTDLIKNKLKKINFTIKCKIYFCGKGIGHCPDGQWCGKNGYYGTTTGYCSIAKRCQSEFDQCESSAKSSTTITSTTITSTTITSTTKTSTTKTSTTKTSTTKTSSTKTSSSNLPTSTTGKCGKKDVSMVIVVEAVTTVPLLKEANLNLENVINNDNGNEDELKESLVNSILSILKIVGNKNCCDASSE